MNKQNWFIRTCKTIKDFFKEALFMKETKEIKEETLAIKESNKQFRYYRRNLLFKKILKYFIITIIVEVIVILICLIFFWATS